MSTLFMVCAQHPFGGDKPPKEWLKRIVFCFEWRVEIMVSVLWW